MTASYAPDWAMRLATSGISKAPGAQATVMSASPTVRATFTVTGPVAIPVQGANRVATAIEASKKFGTAANVVLAQQKAVRIGEGLDAILPHTLKQRPFNLRRRISLRDRQGQLVYDSLVSAQLLPALLAALEML